MMDFQETGPQYFEKKSEILPLSKYGLSSFTQFKEAEKELNQLEELKKIGLTDDEIKLYQKNEKGNFENSKVESSVLNQQVQNVYAKIKNVKNDDVDICIVENQSEPAACSKTAKKLLETLNTKPITFYPEGHPMNNIKNLENDLFNHLKNDNEIVSLSKRRKILRRLEKKREYLDVQKKGVLCMGPLDDKRVYDRKTLWDVKEVHEEARSQTNSECKIIGPKRKSIYTIKNNKIVRLEPLADDVKSGHEDYKAVDIVVPVNKAEKLLLEGTKMSLDDIKRDIKFNNYEPGVPSRVLYLKNIAPSVSKERLILLFNKYLYENQGPINVRLMGGRMRGQAFIEFFDERISSKALQDVNGTIIDGKPIIVQFGRHTNHAPYDSNQ